LAADVQTVKLPASCEACGKTDLWPVNREAWSLCCEYPSLIMNGMDGWKVDYPAAFELLDRLYIEDTPLMIRRLEAIKTGFASVQPSASVQTPASAK